MKKSRVAGIVLSTVSLVLFASAQEKLSKQEWEQQVNQYTQMRNEAQAKLADLTKQVAALQTESGKLDGDLSKCTDELYALVGSDAQKAAAYRAQIEAAEAKADMLLKLSDADLASHRGDVSALAAQTKQLRQNKLSLIPEFSDRLDALDQKVSNLEKSLSVAAEETYTVKSWSRDRDCLWNIAAKNDIYNNAWLWPKIWMGNSDKVKNPDLIFPGEKLSVPAGRQLTASEKKAANRYYANVREGQKQATVERKPANPEQKPQTARGKTSS